MQSRANSKAIVKKEMKIYFLFFTAIICGFTLHAQNISLSLTAEPIERAFRSIEEQTEFRFVFSTETIKNAKPVSIRVSNASLQVTLEKIFLTQPLTYSVLDRQIIVKDNRNERESKLTDVAGKVMDEDGNPLQGVSVSKKGTNSGTLTKANGEFVLKAVDENTVLVFSYIGRETVELPVKGRAFMTVHLLIIPQSLDETVIQAYGKTTRRLNTGNISKVTGEEVRRQPVSNVLGALEGKVPGLVVTQSTGLPGSSFKVQLRGRTAIDLSITDDQPLFIIDGIPFAPNNGFLNSLNSALGLPSNSGAAVSPGGLSPFSLINPHDIESIEVLKDADATAIYGSRGANGVILITTRKGKAGKTAFNFNIQNGISSITRPMPLLNTRQYLDIRHEAFSNDGINPTVSNAYDMLLWDTSRYTDFRKLLVGGNAYMTDVQANVSGGTKNDQFLIGGSYHRESTVFPGNLRDKRATVHFNVGHTSPKDNFKIQLSGNYTSDNNNLISVDLTSSLRLPPNFKIYDSLGKLAWNEGGIISGLSNPLAYLYQKYNSQSDNLLGNIQMTYNFKKTLFLKLNAGYNNVLVSEVQTNPSLSQNPLQTITRSSAFANNSFKSWIIEPQLEYLRQFTGISISALVGTTWQDQINSRQVTNASGYMNDALLESLAGATNISETKSFSRYRYQAIFSRLTFNRKDKYLANFSFRKDGSSRFGPNKQYAYFGSAGAAWIFTKEKFMAHLFPLISFGKLRGSIGTTGNDKIGDYLYLNTWGATTDPYQGGAGLTPLKLFNPDFHWEKTVKFEFAMEMGLLKDKILVSASYYRNRSSNQLVRYRMPSITGFSSVIRNFPALVQNSGLELSLASTNIKTHSFSWSSSANISFPKNKLLSFPNITSSSYSSQYVVGEPLNLIYGYKFMGVDPATGLYTVFDAVKDSMLKNNDYLALGSFDPVFFGGINNSFQYKRLSIEFLLQFVKQKGKNFLGNQFFVPGTINNLPLEAMERWQSPGDHAPIQRFSSLSSGPVNNALINFRSSDGIYGDASFIRLKNISVSYLLPDKWMQKMRFETCRLYFTAQNLLTYTNYPGGDPETQNYLRLPPLKTLSVGLQINF